MATVRTIQSPGVEINEIDLSLRPNIPVGTNVFMSGFSNQGPTDEVLNISSISEFEEVFGKPYTAAERYSYYSAKGVLDSSGNLYYSRLPYGDNVGDIFADEKYSALIYPVLPEDGETHWENLSANGLSAGAGDSFWLLKPTHVELTREQYDVLESGQATWYDAFGKEVDYTDIDNAGYAGLIVLNTSQTTINDSYEGYYIGISDNINTDPASPYKDVISVNSINGLSPNYISIPTTRLDFKLSAANTNENSISEVMESIPSFDIGTSEFDDTISIGLFKLRKTPFTKDSVALSYALSEAYFGSFDNQREIQSVTGGANRKFFLENRDEGSANLKILVNPNLADNFRLSISGNPFPTKKVRTLTEDSTVFGGLSAGYSNDDYVNSLFPLGVYKSENVSSKKIGNLVAKLDRVFDLVENNEIYPIDLTIEAGLGTIFCSNQEIGGQTYNETTTWASLSGLEQQSETLDDSRTVDNYTTIFNRFENFASLRRKDHLFIADSIRQIFVRGENTKILKQPSKTFSQHIYWPLRNQFRAANSSYATVYGNWVKQYDSTSDKQVWVPYSGIAAGLMINGTVGDAPAGFTRGINSVNDIAFSPNQKQRDQLYKIGINPIYFSPSDGFITMGQKTLQRKPSAFDRINVRRTFLFLEKATLNTVRYFVFLPNNLFTRTQVVSVLTPIFELARNSGWIFDYRIICDNRNNTDDVIDDNTLVTDIYIKPTRTAEFLVVNFYATRTSQNFDELI